MRLMSVFGVSAAALLAACTHVGDTQTAAVPADLVTTYSASLSAQLDGERLSRSETSQFRTPAGSDDVFYTTFEDLPAAFFDLADLGSDERRTLIVGMQPTLVETGEVFYRIHLVFHDESGTRPSALANQPELLVALGETATVHLGQDAGAINTSFTLDLSSVPATE